LALLAACGASQPPIGAPGAMPQSSAIVTEADRGGSWMLPEAKNENLIYLADEYSVLVYNYAGEQVGYIEQLIEPGVCSDPHGDVWITSQGHISEYPHGATAPIATLNAPSQAVSCAVDPLTNNLAVTLNDDGNTELAVYPNASGAPQTYAEPAGTDFLYCAYDDAGNLFVDGRHSHKESLLVELQSGSNSLRTLTLNKKLVGGGGVQWDGKYLAVGDERNNVIYQLSIASGYGTVERTIKFPNWEQHHNYQFWVHDGTIGFMYSGKYFGFWKYPKGEKLVRKFLYDFGTTGGNALSLGAKFHGSNP
jgi:hypothetical protein